MKKIRLSTVAAVLTLIALIFVAATLIRGCADEKRAMGTRDDLRDMYYSDDTEETDTSDTAEAAESGMSGSTEKKDGTGSFDKLLKENPDTVGWIKAGEYIDYPVTQRDNDYYLYHGFYGEDDANGIPFVNMYCKLDPRDDVVVIHGHNMENTVMFSTLKYFLDFGYLSKYPIVTFRTVGDEENVYYTPVYIFNASMIPDNAGYFDIMRMKFDGKDEFGKYLEEAKSRSVWEAKTDAGADDELLMLVTCSYDYDDGRLVMLCRKLRDGETPASIRKLYK